MLKRTDSGPNPAGSERPIGEIVGQLVDDGKAYAKSEMDVVKEIAAAKSRQLILPGVLFLSAVLLAISSLSALAMGLFFALAAVMPALLAGLLAFALLAGLAALLGWLGVIELRKVL